MAPQGTFFLVKKPLYFDLLGKLRIIASASSASKLQMVLVAGEGSGSRASQPGQKLQQMPAMAGLEVWSEVQVPTALG